MAIRDMKMCYECLRYRRERDEERKLRKKVEKENRKLREELGRAHRTINEGPFGSSTPSAKKAVKPGVAPEKQAKKGGAKPGHKGSGRGKATDLPERPPEIVRVPTVCPDCAARLAPPSTRSRTLIGCDPPQAFKRTVFLEEAWCPCCQKTIRTQAPEAFPRMLLDNSTLAYVAVEHYFHGQTLGRLAKITGVPKGTLINAMHDLAAQVEPGLSQLERELRLAEVIFADETTWRNDGSNGYAWMFRTSNLVLYRFRGTRAGDVPEELLGLEPLPGVLVTDRYAGYNGIKIRRQFCYAHLLRDLQDLEKEFPEVIEVKVFVAKLAPLLSSAMGLRREAEDGRQYRRRARRIKANIEKIVHSSANHAAVQSYQDIFRRHHDKLYQWVENPNVPPDNNTAERCLRPTVIARKMSFGSQSKCGAKTRETLMSVIGTIALRTDDPWTAFRDALNRIAASPSPPQDIGAILFPDMPIALAA